MGISYRPLAGVKLAEHRSRFEAVLTHQYGYSKCDFNVDARGQYIRSSIRDLWQGFEMCLSWKDDAMLNRTSERSEIIGYAKKSNDPKTGTSILSFSTTAQKDHFPVIFHPNPFDDSEIDL